MVLQIYATLLMCHLCSPNQKCCAPCVPVMLNQKWPKATTYTPTNNEHVKPKRITLHSWCRKMASEPVVHWTIYSQSRSSVVWEYFGFETTDVQQKVLYKVCRWIVATSQDKTTNLYQNFRNTPQASVWPYTTKVWPKSQENKLLFQVISNCYYHMKRAHEGTMR